MIFQLVQRTGLLVLTAVSVLIFIVLSSTNVSADSPGDIYPPFDIGAQWNICQGYDNSPGTHVGTSHLALDITNSGCDNAASGRVVRAPFTGTVSWYFSSSGSLCITATDGRSIMLTHIDSFASPGAPVDNYQTVGSIAAPGQRQNNGVAHLHVQAWSVPGCSGSSNQIPFDSVHRTRICGAPDFTSTGPNTFNNGTWGSTRFIADACSTTIPPSSPSVFRFYSPVTRHHLFTTDVNEMNILRTNGSWNYEGNAYWVKSTGSCVNTESVYRLYSEQLKVHMYTMDENERAELSKLPPDVWRYEGVAFCASRTADSTNRPVHRFYSDYLKSPHYTSDENEKNELMKHPGIWRYEGVAYYAF